MISKKYMPSFVAGFAAGVLSTIPGIKSLNCCLIVPAAAFFSLYLYIKTTGDNSHINLNKALGFGLLTGLIAAFFTTFFDLLITYITHTNDFVTSLPQSKELINEFKLGRLMDAYLELMDEMIKDIKATGFSALYTVLISISNFIVLSIFGMIGGLLGMSILNKRNRPQI